MNRYTIECTESQTKKALELGAPINFKFCYVNGVPFKVKDEDGEPVPITPTAEQMIGWLEEQGLNINISYNSFDDVKIIVTECSCYKEIANIKWSKSRKGATIAAIDAALDYLKTQI